MSYALIVLIGELDKIDLTITEFKGYTPSSQAYRLFCEKRLCELNFQKSQIEEAIQLIKVANDKSLTIGSFINLKSKL